MQYKDNWDETKKKFDGWWHQSNTGRPLMHIVARKPEIEHLSDGQPHEGGMDQVFCQGLYYDLPENLKWKDMEDKYMNPERMVLRYRDFCEKHLFLGEAFPNMETNFGPGSVAAYLGSDIGFKEDTVWFKPCIDEDDDWEDVPPLKFDPENKWLRRHLEVVEGCRKFAGNDFCLDMPDLMENVDVLSSLRGAQTLMMDMIEDPDSIEERVGQVTDAYFEFFDRFYDLVRTPDGGNSYSCFQIWAPGRMAKLQCDASAMMSVDFFDEFVLDSLKKQTQKLDYAMYHLDGPGAIRHLDHLMEIPGINALQWTPGDTGPDGTYEEWDKIYDKVIASGKSLWIKVYSGGFDDWIRNCDRIVRKYGSASIMFYYPEMSLSQAEQLLKYAEENWSDIKGSFRG
ncbi:trimethylamine corrinoid protein 2 [Bilifractor sp. HCP3S3_D3]|uniref:trimethylamine corrinoid protein 2 n=1 Tax=unclassified Bilifractor TaxID=2815795 RepID=UPI003F8B7429|nr:uroporphyrinogen decarboxylase family protein [Eubacterium sp.]